MIDLAPQLREQAQWIAAGPQATAVEAAARAVSSYLDHLEWQKLEVEMAAFLGEIAAGPFMLPGVKVVGDDATDEILVGRDVLNKLRLLLDGPAQRS